MSSALPPVTVGSALSAGTRRLAEAGSDEARLDAEILLADLLGVTRAYLYAHPERPLTPAEQAAWQERLARRARREPVAYITGHREFYGLDLLVDRRVLVPRPETEMIVDRVLALARRRAPRVIWDVGTGSGALALALAYHLAEAQVVAADVSADALQVAERNRRRLGLEGRVRLVQSDLLAEARGPIDVLVANLPYLTNEEYRQAMPEVSCYEPQQALAAGPGGLEAVARLLAQAQALDPPPGTILLEIGATQGPRALALARTHFPDRPATLWRDLAGLDRVIEIGPDCALDEWEMGAQPEGAPTHLLPADAPQCIAVAAEALRQGEIVALPTDTVYGLGAAVFQPQAVQALYEVKGRPEAKAIPLLLASPAGLSRIVAGVPPVAERLVRAFWPGPLTIVMEAHPQVPAAVLSGGHTVALRVPDHPIARALIEAVGAPLATTSANRSGRTEALTAIQVVEQLGKGVRWVLDGGRSPGGRPSTVVDLSVEPPAIRRQGAVSEQALATVMQEG